MTFKVTMMPGGREFEIESNESLLDAGLRAGLNLNYSCSSGTCGECQATLIDGEFSEIKHHDFAISSAKQSQGVFLLCRAFPASDLTIEAEAFSRPDEMPVQLIETKVTKLERVSEHYMVLHLRTPRSQTLRFLAGQHVTLLVDGLGPRNKSVASCPCNAMHLQFHFKESDHDEFSQHVFNKMKTGDKISIRGPWGSFVLEEESTRPIIMVAHDTGFGPVKSLIEHAIALELDQGLHLYWVSDEPHGHYLKNYCRSWEDALDDFSFTVIGGDRMIEPEARASFFLSALDEIKAKHKNISEFDFYVTAPRDAIQSSHNQLVNWGVGSEHVRVDSLERF